MVSVISTSAAPTCSELVLRPSVETPLQSYPEISTLRLRGGGGTTLVFVPSGIEECEVHIMDGELQGNRAQHTRACYRRGAESWGQHISWWDEEYSRLFTGPSDEGCSPGLRKPNERKATAWITILAMAIYLVCCTRARGGSEETRFCQNGRRSGAIQSMQEQTAAS